MKYRIAILNFFIFLMHPFNCIAQSPADYKYLMIINYLQNDSGVQEKIKDLYSQIKLYNRKEKDADFKINDTVEFFSLSIFRFHDTLKSAELGIEQKLIDSSVLYRNQFYFEPFELSFLKRLPFRKDAQLYLTFSQPVGNYVIVELNNKRNDPKSIRKTGVAMSILFIFDEDGFIRRTSIQSGVYH